MHDCILYKCVHLITDFDFLCVQTCGYVSEEIMHMEAEDALEKLRVAESVCRAYQASFFEHRRKLPSYTDSNGSPAPEWNFDPLLVFSRLERFLQQIDTIQVRMYVGQCQVNFLCDILNPFTIHLVLYFNSHITLSALDTHTYFLHCVGLLSHSKWIHEVGEDWVWRYPGSLP